MEWQPIETAPRDGTVFLGIGRYCEHAACHKYLRNKIIPVYEGRHIIEAESDFGTEYVEANPLTHWMPLPKPPQNT